MQSTNLARIPSANTHHHTALPTAAYFLLRNCTQGLKFTS